MVSLWKSRVNQRTKNKEQRTKNYQNSQFPTYRGLDSALPGKLPVAESITEKVICLPLYPELPLNTIEVICGLL
jgi:dTDP-4-amino-4,6-dideoxygalactose transaminase